MRYELIIRGGTVVDGTGYPRRVADVAVSGGVILYVSASDLAPEVIRMPGSRSMLLMLSGVVLYALSHHLLRVVGLP